MPLKKFLSLVLPEKGVKCWVEISKDKKVIQGFADSVDKLANKLQEIDGRGVDAYFACASFKEKGSRRTANALGARAFWLDIDAGEGKPYAAADEAIDALDEFCARVQLDVPAVVRSGGGIHAYWVLDRMLMGDEWRSVAQRLKLLTHSHGLHADPTRTADISSILRPPGTKNYKLSKEDAAAGRSIPASPRCVEVDDWTHFSPIPCRDFIDALIKNPNEAAPLFINNPLITGKAIEAEPAPRPAENGNLTSGLPISKAFDSAHGVTEGGRNDACARYAGELLAKGHGHDEALRLCLDWNRRNHPPMDDQEVRTTVASISRRHRETHPAPALHRELPVLPHSYKWSEAKELTVGIKTPSLTEKDKVDTEWKVVSRRPVFLKSIMNMEGCEQKNSYLFEQFHSLKGWQQFTMNAREMNGKEWYGTWFERGGELMVGADKYFTTYVRETANMLRTSGKESTRYSQFGWKNDDTAFLVGDYLCRDDGSVERAYGSDKLSPLMKAMMPARGGSLENWTAAADKLFTPGMEAHGFMLLASFAAPLMKFCVDEGNGGAVLSVISEESGQGKTPMATAAASIWGELAATLVTGNFTENRRIEELVRHCHIIQIQEEAAYSDPLVAAQGIEKFTSGTDRGRLTQGGNASGMPERYQTILLSLSNKSLYELVKMVNIPMSRRIFEVEMERPEEAAIANMGGIAREMMRNHGHAGLQFVRVIVSPQMRRYISEHLTGSNTGTVGSVQLKYRQTLASQPEHRFIVWLLSAIEVAARIVTHVGILHFDVDRIMAWATTQAQTKIYATKPEDASVKLNSFLSEHIDHCLTVTGPYAPKFGALKPIKMPSRQLCMRLEMRNARLFISHDAMQKWCTKNNISFVGFGRKLRDAEVLLESSKLVTLGAGTEVASGRTLCWEIDMAHPMISGQLRIEMREEAKPKLGDYYEDYHAAF